jgi:hypothetical protein
MVKALEIKGLHVPETPLELKITVQGGVGTAEEHDFLLEQYQVDSVGWGSPFLLVPEATSVDVETRRLLEKAKEDDFYLSPLSPLGIPFNAVKGTTNDFFRQKRIQEEKAGSSCPKKFLALSKEYGPKGMCPASKNYQDLKLEELDAIKDTLTNEAFDRRKNTITEKACLCVGLANASYLENDIKIKGQPQGVVVCPGPNLAYFDKEVSLLNMVQHIYGNASVLGNTDRPNVIINELKMYMDYLKKEINEFSEQITVAQTKKLKTFKSNLNEGIEYYQSLIASNNWFDKNKQNIERQLKLYKDELINLCIPEQTVAVAV